MKCPLLPYHTSNLSDNLLFLVIHNKLDLIKYLSTTPLYNDIRLYNEFIMNAILNNNIRMTDFLLTISRVDFELRDEHLIYLSIVFDRIDVFKFLLEKPGVIDYVKYARDVIIETIQIKNRLEEPEKVIELLRSIK